MTTSSGAAGELFHPLPSAMAPPPKFTYPFCYEPHPLCQLAATLLQSRIAQPSAWREEAQRGKMFGVLVCADGDGQMGYLAAFSGQLGGTATLPFFVPAVFDYLQPGGHFKRGEAQISAINRRIDALLGSADYSRAQAMVAQAIEASRQAIDSHKQLMARAKQQRDALRAQGAGGDELIRQSQYLKAELRRLKVRKADMVANAQQHLGGITTAIEELKAQRRRLSDELQMWLFSQHKMLNALGQVRTLTDIFATATGALPPSGAGECCAPKLLQYAYTHHLRPLCMAEFWWGESPVGELRRHLDYYPACRGKCLPILTHMLRGLEVDANPLAQASNATLAELYHDDTLAVVCKPSGLPSVPGRLGLPSVQSVLQERWAGLQHPFMVHRLDMDTSGLLVVAKSIEAQRQLRAQFEAHTISKKYVALLEAPGIGQPQGRISLPLRPDLLDRPRQVVDMEHGRQAITCYKLLATQGGHARVALHPITGRTHQLRVHCAHHLGLNSPIVGDAIYGHRADRLCLHAERLVFVHPVTGKRMSFNSEVPF